MSTHVAKKLEFIQPPPEIFYPNVTYILKHSIYLIPPTILHSGDAFINYKAIKDLFCNVFTILSLLRTIKKSYPPPVFYVARLFISNKSKLMQVYMKKKCFVPCKKIKING